LPARYSMIRLDEQFSLGAETADGLQQSLAALLNRRWQRYRKALKHCREKFSEKSVHALRVEIRRMLSTLGLIGAATPHELIAVFECELEDRLKSLSRLRDT